MKKARKLFTTSKNKISFLQMYLLWVTSMKKMVNISLGNLGTFLINGVDRVIVSQLASISRCYFFA